ncbi:CHAP domain-containing protein [Sphingomonas sp. BIUV-7]|uniref:CHAP domain-containing protein n=1 Tax=Sphingomonas natans TaxID=3063330 RepID=A0ABT8YDH8_9SPHN|nr:CHAP domain-containing protein [Sphingomonas sp. BIUV-7]MDO6416435.1 CHAP domain-containing protein [Sphingomonas sp. BIUV-7]
MFKSIRAAAAALVLIASVAAPTAANAQTYWQCAPFARVFSGIQLFGAAASWWHQAIGKYASGGAPKAGSVLVFKAIGAMRSGHVATVTKIVSDRIIKVTHANWGGAKGRVENDVTVVDASPNGDWSQVKVWYSPIHDIGQRAYPTYGFIYGGAKAVAAEAVAAGHAIEARTANTGA